MLAIPKADTRKASEERAGCKKTYAKSPPQAPVGLSSCEAPAFPPACVNFSPGLQDRQPRARSSEAFTIPMSKVAGVRNSKGGRAQTLWRDRRLRNAVIR